MADEPTAPETGATPAEPANPAPETGAPAAPIRLPDDHPLVKAYEATRGELKSLTDAKKTELQRATDDLTSERARAAGLETELNQLRAALKHGIDLEDVDLLGTGTADEIEARAKRLAGRVADSKKKNNVVPKEGAASTAKPNDERTFVRELFGSGT